MLNKKILKELAIALFFTGVIILCFLFSPGMESRFIYTDF